MSMSCLPDNTVTVERQTINGNSILSAPTRKNQSVVADHFQPIGTGREYIKLSG